MQIIQDKGSIFFVYKVLCTSLEFNDIKIIKYLTIFIIFCDLANVMTLAK